MPKASKIGSIIKIVIIVLAIVLLVLIFFFVRQSIIIRREQILSARELWISNLFKHRGPPTRDEVAFVQPWMTFDYVSQLFNVSSTYLEQQLSISSSNYPHVTISSYAHHNNLNVGAFLVNVDQALIHDLPPATSTPSRV